MLHAMTNKTCHIAHDIEIDIMCDTACGLGMGVAHILLSCPQGPILWMLQQQPGRRNHECQDVGKLVLHARFDFVLEEVFLGEQGNPTHTTKFLICFGSMN